LSKDDMCCNGGDALCSSTDPRMTEGEGP